MMGRTAQLLVNMRLVVKGLSGSASGKIRTGGEFNSVALLDKPSVRLRGMAVTYTGRALLSIKRLRPSRRVKLGNEPPGLRQVDTPVTEAHIRCREVRKKTSSVLGCIPI